MGEFDKWKYILGYPINTNNLLFNSYTLKISGVGTNGSSLSFYGKRETAPISDYQLGYWGCGFELIFGGHPSLTKNKTRWPFSFTIGTSYSIQDKVDGYDEDEWDDIKEIEGIPDITRVYLTYSLQRLAYKKGLSIYCRFDASFIFQRFRAILLDYPYLYDDIDVIVRGGVAFGILF